MNERASFIRKIVYIFVIAALLLPLSWLSQPETTTQTAEGTLVHSKGGALAQYRREHRLSQANLGDIDPASETIKLATLGLKGVAANLLWDKAIEAKKVTVIDVNGSDSWKQGRIPGAIDFEANKAKLASMLPKEKDALIVAYCGGPECGAYQSAAKAAKELGYTNVKHLKAGISGWKAAERKVEKS